MNKNKFEIKGNLTDAPKQIDNATFVTVAINSKTEATFIDVAFFKDSKTAIDKLNLEKGAYVEVSGFLGNKKNAETGFSELTAVGNEIAVLVKQVKKETAEEKK